jgi:hypothetical protein
MRWTSKVPSPGAGAGEGGILGEESVPGVHGLRAGLACRLQDAPDVKVALAGRSRADPDGDVGLAYVPGAGVGVTVDRDAANAVGPQRGDDADRDLAPVRHQNLPEHWSPHIRNNHRSRRTPYAITVLCSDPMPSTRTSTRSPAAR